MAALLVTTALVLAGCTTDEPGDLGSRVPTPGAPTASLTVDTVISDTYSTGYSCDAAAVDAAGGDLPDIALPCLDGSGPVSLARLRGPLVLTIWASWCEPCRRELPAFVEVHGQALEQQAGIRFLGIDWLDDPRSAVAFAQEVALDFPSVHDPEGVIRGPLRITTQPATLFVDEAGRIRHVERSAIDDPERLRALIDDHLGVAIRG